jgi:hypothetical protein
VGALVQSERQSSCQPVFNQPNTADRTLVAVLDVRQQVGLSTQRQMALQCENGIAKSCIILGYLSVVSGEMDVDAAPAQLRTEIAERE